MVRTVNLPALQQEKGCTMDEAMDEAMENFILYGPRDGKSLKRLYPEIEADPKFKPLANEDLLFAWYIGIPGSPIDNEWAEPLRYKTAAARCFPKNDVKKQKFASQDVPDDVKQAIREFECKSPEARLMAKLMTQRTFHRFKKILDVDVQNDFNITRTIGKGEDKEEITEVNWTAKKQYVDSAEKIIEMLPSMVKKIEEGFGMTEKQKKEEGTVGSKPIDRYHSNIN